MSVDEASAFEDTLARIRERYALYFYLPEGVKPGEERAVEVELSAAARQRFPGAEVRYRRSYLAPNGSGDSNALATQTGLAIQTARATQTGLETQMPRSPSRSEPLLLQTDPPPRLAGMLRCACVGRGRHWSAFRTNSGWLFGTYSR